MRLPRMTTRRWMIAVAVLAATFEAFVKWMEVDRYQWRQHLNTEMTWCRSPIGQFYVKYSIEEHSANSLLKVWELGSPDRKGDNYRHRWWLGPGGELGAYGRWIGVREAGPPIHLQEARRRSRRPSTMGNAFRRQGGEETQAARAPSSKGRD